jgi:hypothetical protein
MKLKMSTFTAAITFLLFSPIIDARTCFLERPAYNDPTLQAVIEVSAGNYTFTDRKCSFFYPYYAHEGITAENCAANAASITLDKGYAPFGVMFRGSKSTPRNDIKDYKWEFFDTDGTTLLKRKLHDGTEADAVFHSWNAAWVYDTPGTYTAKLTITRNNDTTATATKTVTVWARDGQNYYVDSAIGDDRYSGESETVAGGCDVETEPYYTCDGPWKTATRAFSEMAPVAITSGIVDGKMTANNKCLTFVEKDFYLYGAGAFSLYRSQANLMKNRVKDVNGKPYPKQTSAEICSTLKSSRTSVLGPGDSVLFKRGQTFDMETGLLTLNSYNSTDDKTGIIYNYENIAIATVAKVGHWSSAMGVHFGAYGASEDPKPLIKNTGKYASVVIDFSGAGGFHFAMTDLSFDLESPYRNILASRMNRGNRSVLIAGTNTPINLIYKNLDARRMEQGIVLVGDAYTDSSGTTENHADGLFIFNNNFYDSMVVQVFTQNGHEDVALVDNRLEFAANHLIYSSLSNSLVYGNLLSKPSFGRTAYRMAGSETGDINNWIGHNLMEGWIDPRTYDKDGREWSANGTSWHNSFINFNPNVQFLDSHAHTIYDTVFDNNTITGGAQQLMNIGNVDGLRVTNNTFTNADSEMGGARIELSALTASRPTRNVEFSGNTFNETGGNPAGSSIFGIENYRYESCEDQADHADIRIVDNIFNLASNEAKLIKFAELKQYGTTDKLPVASAETKAQGIFTVTGNTLNVPGSDYAPLQVGGDSTSIKISYCTSGFDPYCSGTSFLGNPYRLYNSDSTLYPTMFGGNTFNVSP